MRVLAYLDPGSGSMVLQALLGGTAAVLVSIKMFGKRVFSTLFFWRKNDEESPAEETSSTEKSASPTGAPTQDEREKEPVS